MHDGDQSWTLKFRGYTMNKFKSYVIGVVIAMALVLRAIWFKGGVENVKTARYVFSGLGRRCDIYVYKSETCL